MLNKIINQTLKNFFREEEDCEDAKLKPNDRSLRTYLSNGEIDANSKIDSSEDVSAKANTNGAALSADCRTSSSSDITLLSSDGSSRLDSVRENGLRNGGIAYYNDHGFLSDASHPLEPQKHVVNASAVMYDIHQRSHWDWSACSEHSFSTDSSSNGSQDKELNVNLQLQLKKTQDANSELVLAVQDLNEMLEQKNREIYSLSNKHEEGKNSHEFAGKLSNFKEHNNAKDTHLLEQKIIDLYGEIEMYRNKYECSSPPPAVDDVEAHIQNLENQLKQQSEEFSNSLATIKKLETQIRRLEEELEKQAEGFEADVDAVTRDKVEQEQTAIRAEEALRNTRHKNANTAERLQEEFRRLSTQMASTFDANEKAAMRALTKASELHAQKRLVEAMLHKVNEELQSAKAEYEVKLNELSNKIDMMTAQKQQMFLEIEDKSKQLENQKTREEQSRTVESNELVSEIALLKKETERSLDELNRIKNLKYEKELAGRVLQSELEALRTQYNDLKSYLLGDEAEKENLRKQVFQLKGELKKKDDALINIEKKFKDSNGHTQLFEGTKTNSKNKKGASIPQTSKEMANLREKIKTLEARIKSKETALEMSTSSFLEKERELQSKIEELEDKVEEFNHSIALQKERNNSMETELKELQQRYSEMSLRFVEVEGERQKLVMTVRNLKNARKAQMTSSSYVLWK
uniref:Uncharacterized protein n=1 Tax=Glycine max TaxID=3847 RepID=A0A0R0LAY5_SOYBN